MPDGWVPPVDAWQAGFPASADAIMCSYVGAQSLDPAVAAQAIEALTPSCRHAQTIERARFVDAHGFTNDYLILYWTTREARDRFWAQEGAGGWWHRALAGESEASVWREEFAALPARFETLFSSRCPRGAGTLGETLGEPTRRHGYWGGMRDRIAAAANDPLEPFNSAIRRVEAGGRHVSVRPQGNLCIIRSGQDWSACSADERALYEEAVLPRLQRGMRFLRDEGVTAGCLSCRFSQELTLDGSPLERSFTSLIFVSLAHLERWAHTHPTHIAIFEAFMAMAAERKDRLALALWHEVFVIDAEQSLFEYIDCAGNGHYGFAPGENALSSLA